MLNRDKPKVILAIARSVRAHTIGGMEDHIADLYESLTKSGWSIHVITAGVHDIDYYSERGVHYYPMKGSQPVYNQLFWDKSVVRFTELFNTLSPNLIHAHSYAAEAIRKAGLIPPDLPFVVTLYGTPLMNLDHHFHQCFLDDWQRKLWHLQQLLAISSNYVSGMPPRSFGDAAHLIAISKKQVQEIRVVHRVSDHHLHNIDFGVDVQYFVPAGMEEKFEARKRLEISEANLVVGTVCRLVPEKGVQILIRAINKARNEIQNIKLVVVGDGIYRSVLENLALKLGCQDAVCFIGALSPQEIVQAYHAMDIFALGSIIGESFGLVVAQAMACEVPVVGSRIGALPQIVDGDDPPGVLVPRSDINGFSRAFINLARNSDYRKTLGSAGRKRVLRYYSLADMAHKTEMLFSSLSC